MKMDKIIGIVSPLYIGNFDIQFGVFSIEYQKNKVYVVFEGTDKLFSGWIEDFMLSCEFPTISHKKAINYLNKHYTFNNKELIVSECVNVVNS